MEEKVLIFDTTLRDGEQSPGASMNPTEKLTIAKQLARLNVDIIEAGFPVTSKGDFEAVKLIAKNIDEPTICALARMNKNDIDTAIEALANAKKPRLHVFISSSDIHLKYQLKMTRAEVTEITKKMITYAKNQIEDIEFSPMDASRSDIEFLYKLIETAIKSGATTINIPDTVGYSTPYEFGKLIKGIRENVKGIEKVTISVHCHNDLGLATSNSLEAIIHGARQVECAINGLGERAGNASLEEIVMALKTRKDFFKLSTNIDTKEIYKTSRLVSSITGIDVQANKAIVGANAFRHESGIHQDGILKERTTYEIMDARSIGISQSTLVLGKHSGRHAFINKLNELGYDLNREDLNKAFARFKEIADAKKEVSDWDIESIIADEIYHIPETFHLEYLHVMCGGLRKSTATIGIMTKDTLIEESAIGVGPVDAVYQGIKKITKIPNTLVDFTVKSVTGGLDALGEVVVKLSDEQGRIFTGRGASLDIIEASAKAYLNAINKLVDFQKSNT